MADDLTDPARAFDDLRRELSLLVRAVQGLTAEHRETPDYTETLKGMQDHLIAARRALAAIAESPAMKLTPANVADQFQYASQIARRADAELINTAARRAADLATQLTAGLAQVRNAQDQRRILIRIAGGSAAIGLIFGLLSHLFW
jgi:hypothetical protein